MARNWTIGTAILGVCLSALGCTAEMGVDESEEQISGQSATTIQQGLDAAVAKNEARIAPLRSNKAASHYRDKFGSEPYLRLHSATQTVKGTVVVFHGFSGMPIQQNPLVDYLFTQGYDVFDASVAGHYKVNVSGRERSFLGSDRLKSGGLTPLENTFIAWPYADYGHDPVKEYSAEVETTFEIMKTLRAPFFAAGLSAGATQAIGLAASHPKEFKRVVALAPLLDLEPKKKKQLTSAAALITVGRGIAGAGEWDGWFAWDKSNPFPQGCFWGLQKYGQSLLPRARAFQAEKQQVFLVTTDNEDAADSSQTKRFFDAAGGSAAGHVLYNYRAEQRVPHPINGLDSRSQGMINYYYKTLFQETVRFLDKGTVKTERLGLQDLAREDGGKVLPGFTEPARMDWDLLTFGGPDCTPTNGECMRKALPGHIDVARVK